MRSPVMFTYHSFLSRTVQATRCRRGCSMWPKYLVAAVDRGGKRVKGGEGVRKKAAGFCRVARIALEIY